MPRELRQEKALFAKSGIATILLTIDGKELRYLLLVFLTIQSAGSVKKHATGLKFGPCILKDGGLQALCLVQLVRRQTQAQFSGSPKRTCTTARHIKKDERKGGRTFAGLHS